MKAKSKVEKSRAASPISKKELTRKKIIAAARKCFAKKGFDTTNVSDIVKKIGMAQGTFYYHFFDKKSVLIEILNEFFGRVISLAKVWSATTEVGPEITRNFARNTATILYENSDIARIIMKESHNPDPDIRKAIDEFYGYLYEQSAAALQLGIALGAVRPMDTKIASVALIGMMKEVVFELIKEKDAVNLEHVIDELALLQDFGIRPGETI